MLASAGTDDCGNIMLIIPGKNDGLLAVKSLKDARTGWIGFDGVITIEDAKFPDGFRVPPSGPKQVVFQFDDTDRIGGKAQAPTVDQVRAIITYARTFLSKRLLVHCLQGQSRSAAAALAILADRLGSGKEEQAVQALIAICPLAVCNRVVLNYADQLLQRNGALTRAWQDYEDKNDKAAGVRLLRSLAERTE